MAHRTSAVADPGPDAPPPGPAQRAMLRQSIRFTVVLRLTSCAMGGAVALTGRATAARPGWVTVCAVALIAWGVLFVLFMLARGPSRWLLAGDVALVVALCLAHRELVPGQVLQASAGTGWVDIAAGSGVFIAQFALRQPSGMAVALLIAAAYTAGAPGLREAPVLLVVQGALAATLVGLLRREARAVDRELAGRAEAAAAAAARSAARADERDQQRRLHDTVLATLTIVGAGGIEATSPVLAGRAAADLAVIDGLRTGGGGPPPGGPPRNARLDLALRAAVAAPRPGLPALRVTADVAPCELRHDVVEAIAGSAEEALLNVARHAGTGTARLGLVRTTRGAVLTIADEGAGFDPAAVPPQRRGLRESIHGRMSAVGGGARVESRPGTGTRVRLWWPDE
ncbi:sensor histidine kinase [Actinomadura algeriensis]|uniref:Signal transduction histidine kinase n=1 Tax=Actinomadura algeriensis TaxID=1679523 RepID=A0ABR9K1J7_9ACTN|nr:sensor histidine kinase [Actinomadura algeriensis]MBE1536707.1 signal transduction histidine kinase [Actinomadura algeriensis]